MLSLETLQVLDAIDRKGSFAAAAAELGKVPSALTYVVRKLETQLDALLFDRRGHRAKLTPAGLELLREGRHLLHAADELERRVRRVATGWEVELRIAVDGLISIDALLEVVRRFYAEEPGTRLRLFGEVLSGTWDALLAGRADLALGTSSATPGGVAPTSGFQSRFLGEVEMVFVVTPDHPLATAREPLAPEQIRLHRAVAVGDSARNLPTVTVGLLGGQDVLTVPDMGAKVAAQLGGLGCGNLPLHLALPHIQAGRLVPKLLRESRVAATLHYAGCTSGRGKALLWFLKCLADADVRKALLR